MIIPLDELVGFEGNRYALTCATIKRAIQLKLTEDEELKANNGKIVPTAINQVLTGKVKYKITEE